MKDKAGIQKRWYAVHFKIVLVAAVAVVAAVGGTAGQASGPRAEAIAAADTGCVLQAPRLSSGLVSDSARCQSNGKPVLARLSYTYRQLDQQKSVCSAADGTGASFKPKIPGTYTLQVTFTAKPAVRNSLVRVSRSKSFALGSRVTNCTKLKSSNPLPPEQMCGYQFSTGETCGVAVRKTSDTEPLPTWDSKPTIVGNTVYAPTFASLSARCSETVQVPLSKHLTWLGEPVYSAYYTCGNGMLLAPQVFVYYAPNGVFDNSSCSAKTNTIQLGGEFTRFSVPADWGGNLAVVWEMLIYDKGLFLGYIYADNSFQLTGTVNGCPELTAPPGD